MHIATGGKADWTAAAGENLQELQSDRIPGWRRHEYRVPLPPRVIHNRCLLGVGKPVFDNRVSLGRSTTLNCRSYAQEELDNTDWTVFGGMGVVCCSF